MQLALRISLKHCVNDWLPKNTQRHTHTTNLPKDAETQYGWLQHEAAVLQEALALWQKQVRLPWRQLSLSTAAASPPGAGSPSAPGFAAAAGRPVSLLAGCPRVTGYSGWRRSSALRCGSVSRLSLAECGAFWPSLQQPVGKTSPATSLESFIHPFLSPSQNPLDAWKKETVYMDFFID